MIIEIRTNDKYANQQMDALLSKEGIRRDKNLDYSCGIFDEEYKLLATGSCFKNTIRCTAVSEEHQGEGLLNQIMSHLMTIQAERGNGHVFLYTKPDSALFYSDVGFYEIARTDKVVFMENRRRGFADWIESLKESVRDNERIGKGQATASVETAVSAQSTFSAKTAAAGKTDVSAIVMNANPFTKGHRYLVEKASRENRLVHLFIVSEEAGPIPFSVRRELVHRGTADLENVICHDSGDYIISSATFPGYFLEDEEAAVKAQAELDIKVFSLIAKELGVGVRYAGDEPYSVTTGIYNQVMQSLLPEADVECVIVPRLKAGERAISASLVRKAIHDGDLEKVMDMLPVSTLDFFRSDRSRPVIRAIMESAGRDAGDQAESAGGGAGGPAQATVGNNENKEGRE